MEISKPKKEYKSNHSLFYSCQYHVVWCTKYRRKVIEPSIEKRLKELVLDKQEGYGYQVLEMEVMPDHVHLLIDHNPQDNIVKTVGMIKGYLSNVLRKEFASLRTRIPCLWTRSKFISTVGSVSLEVVKKYIQEQKGK